MPRAQGRTGSNWVWWVIGALIVIIVAVTLVVELL